LLLYLSLLPTSMEQSPSSEVYSHSGRNIPPFMKPEVSSPCSQKPTTGPYPEPEESRSHPPPYFPKIHSNIIFSPTPTCDLLPSGFPTEIHQIMCNSHLSHACYMPHHLIICFSSRVCYFGAGIFQWYSTGLRAGWSGVRVPGGAGNFSNHHSVRTSSGAHPASYAYEGLLTWE
jgi:hypothetical protein